MDLSGHGKGQALDVSSQEWHTLSAHEISRRVRSGALRAVELVEYLLKRMSTIDSQLGAMWTLIPMVRLPRPNKQIV